MDLALSSSKNKGEPFEIAMCRRARSVLQRLQHRGPTEAVAVFLEHSRPAFAAGAHQVFAAGSTSEVAERGLHRIDELGEIAAAVHDHEHAGTRVVLDLGDDGSTLAGPELVAAFSDHAL